MTRGGDPILVENRAAAAVSAREAEEGRPTYGHLPGPSAERRVFAADDPRFRSWEQRRYSALHILALVGGRDRHHRTRSLLARRRRSLAIGQSLRRGGTSDASTDCTTRRSHHRHHRGRRVSCNANGCRGHQCSRRRCAQHCGFLRGSRPG